MPAGPAPQRQVSSFRPHAKCENIVQRVRLHFFGTQKKAGRVPGFSLCDSQRKPDQLRSARATLCFLDFFAFLVVGAAPASVEAVLVSVLALGVLLAPIVLLDVSLPDGALVEADVLALVSLVVLLE
jgi:hypothetical protein